MSDEKVTIDGIGKPGSFPDWATDKTLKSIEKNATKSNAAIIQLLAKMAMGEKIQEGQYKAMMKELREQRKQQEKENERRKKKDERDDQNQDDDVKHRTKVGALFSGMKQLMKEQLGFDKTKEDREKAHRRRVTELMQKGLDKQSAESAAGLEGMSGALSMFKGAAGKALGGVTAAVGIGKAVNDAVMGQLTDRGTFAAELRQSGLMAGLSDIEGSMGAFSKAVGEAGMTMGETAEFTQQFNQAVGDIGVTRAIQLVDQLAYGMEEAGGLMKQYALNFGQSAKLTGEYLDTLKNLGVLSQMKDEDIRRGMDSFMTSVAETSSVLKISMEESAALIKSTLQEERTAVSLGMLEAQGATVQQINDLRSAIASSQLFGENSRMGEMLTRRLVSGGSAQFRATQEGQAMLDNPVTLRLLNEIDKLGSIYETQGVDAMKEAMGNVDVMSILSRMSETERQLIERGEGGEAAKLIQELMMIRGRTEDRTAMPGVTAEDYQIQRYMDMERRLTLGVEKALSGAIAKTDIATSLEKRNNSTLKLIDTTSTTLENIATTMSQEIVSSLNKSVELLAEAGNILVNTANGITNAIKTGDGDEFGTVGDEGAIGAAKTSEYNRLLGEAMAVQSTWFGDENLATRKLLESMQTARQDVSIVENDSNMLKFTEDLKSLRKEEYESNAEFIKDLKDLMADMVDKREMAMTTQHEKNNINTLISTMKTLISELNGG